MKIAIVSDEISSDFSTAVEIGTDWGVRAFEIRGLCSGRVPYTSRRDIERVLEVKEEFGIEISALSPGAFKLPVDSEEVERHLEDMLPRTYDLAHRLGTDLVIVFGFHRPRGRMGSYPSKVLDMLGRAADSALKEGILLALENEPGCWADTGKLSAEIVKRVGHPNLRLNWDPCNSLNSGGKPYPEEYEEIKDIMVHLHIKDSREGRYVPVGEGDVNWRGQLRALLKDGFEGYYTLETHYGPKVKASRRCLENLRRILLEV